MPEQSDSLAAAGDTERGSCRALQNWVECEKQDASPKRGKIAYENENFQLRTSLALHLSDFEE